MSATAAAAVPKRRLDRRLSFRLLAIFVVTSLIYAFAGQYAVKLVRNTDYLREIVGSHIALHAQLVIQQIGSPPDPVKAQEIADRIPVDIRIRGPGVDWASDPKFPALASIPFGPIEILELDERSLRELKSWARTLDSVRVANVDRHVYAAIRNGDYEIVFASPRVREQSPPDLTVPAIIVTSVLVLTLCYLAVRRLFRPVQWIHEGTARIGQGNLDYRIPIKRSDELGELALDINRMADDVRGMLEAKQQLLLAISHELRSPLTRSKVALEFLDDCQVKKDLLDDIKEMERLIADLLESERMNTGHTTLQRSDVDLKQLIESVVDHEFAERRTQIELQLPEGPVVRSVDDVRIRLVVKNLVDNALRYNPTGGRAVQVALAKIAGSVRIAVRDHGPGIPPEHLSRITEPFYRADPARSRTTGGMGLGLYLCRRIAEAHGGTLTVHSDSGQGTLVWITLPDVVATASAA